MRAMRAADPRGARNVSLLLAAGALALGSACAGAGPRWGADYFPNVPLVNQDGKTLRFYDDLIKGKVVEVNFIYTSCPDSCPLETAKLRQVQEVLGDRVGRDIFMYSISLDPEHDTPAVLKKYAEKFKVGPGWQFLTGKQADIDLVRKKLGLDQDRVNIESHTASLIVGNEATGRWIKRSTFDNPKILASVIGERLFNYRRHVAKRQSYAAAPKYVKIDNGEDLFRRRCQVCHTLGNGDAVGPDLMGVVARRDPAWLARWLKEPDKMLAEKDPIAMALYKNFKELQMPNLRLSDGDVNDLIGYLRAQSERVANAKDSGAQQTSASGSASAHGGG